MEAIELAKQMTPDMLPDPYNLIAEVVGVENTLAIAQKIGGTRVYIAKYDSLIRDARNQIIQKECKFGNYKELAAKYGLTESWVRQIAKEA